jgi:isoamylase
MSTPVTTHQLHFGPFHHETENTVTFSLYSANATRIELCVFESPQNTIEVERHEMIQLDNGRWERKFTINQLAPKGDVLYYGYRLWGPNWVFDPQWKPGTEFGFIADCDSQGNRFNPNKVLIDPWTTEISHDPAPRLSTIDPNEYDEIYYSGEEFRARDTAKCAPKSMLVLHQKSVHTGEKPKRLLKDDIIYEVNLRGFTCQDFSLPEKVRGTYKGAGMKANYLKELGVTAIEFLPVHQFANEQNDDGDVRGDNFWGYMTLGYFAPNRRYASDRKPGGPTREFREMVHAFHKAGIKVFVDVVFNHTGEGLLRRSTEDNDSREDDHKQFPDQACLLSFRGIDNAAYYALRTSNADHGITNQRYQDNSACGGNLNVTSPIVRTLILDSLKYWSTDMGVDGFRFDLAPILGNTLPSDGFHFNIDDQDNFLHVITREMPVRTATNLNGTDLIAEPWALGIGNTYQLGHFPDGWAEWNDIYRKTARRFENKFRIEMLPPFQVANIVSGSYFEFRRNSKRKEPCPWNSVNYVSSHDDYSLRDVFSYTGGEDSWDHGNNPADQRKAVRNAIALLMTSAGVPMICGGDEHYRTQEGHTNVVAFDNDRMHLNWHLFNQYSDAIVKNRFELIEQLSNDDTVRIYRFIRSMGIFRKRYASLRPESFFTGLDISGKGLKDITWYRYDGNEMAGTDWDLAHFLAWRIDNQEYARPGDAGSFYIAYNWSDTFVECTLPAPLNGMHWRRYADTAEWFEYAGNCDSNPVVLDQSYSMHPRSVLVLFEQ